MITIILQNELPEYQGEPECAAVMRAVSSRVLDHTMAGNTVVLQHNKLLPRDVPRHPFLESATQFEWR